MSGLEFGLIFDTLDVGIIILDAQGRIVGWNEWIARGSKQAKKTVLGKNFYDIFPAMRATRLPSVIEDSLTVGSSGILTHNLNKLLPLFGADGNELLHNIIVRPIVSGGSSHCLLQINDVSLAVARERVLRERQNARYHAIVDSAPDAMITTSLDGSIQWSNGSAERAFGYSSPELLEQPIDILLEQDAASARAFFSGSGEGRDFTRSLQVVGRRKDGTRAYFDVSFGRWKADERVFVTTIWRDVTERLVAEAALRESEGRHRALLEALPQLVWTCDSTSGCDYFNPQWQEYTGAPGLEHLGWQWLNAIHTADRQGFESAWRAAVTSGEVFDVDARLRRADDSYRWFKMRSIPVRDSDGSITKWFGTATDITDHIEAREALRHSNEELEARVFDRTREREIALSQLHESQKMEAIGQLTGGVAHDFNNLLAVILGSLSLLKKGLPDDPRTSRLLDGAIQGAERGATLTKRLLAFARRQELKAEAVEVQKLIPDMMDFLRQTIGPSISVHIDVPSDIPPIKVDANQLELALMNLAVNARDAMPKGGSLTITGRDNPVGERAGLPKALPRGDYVRISVSDTGEGMNEQTLTKAMEPFFTTKGVGKGTGLGLSMVQGLTAQSGGGMDIASQLGQGTTVTLWLPRARPEDIHQAPSTPLAPSTAATRKLRILLVDDDSLVSMNTTYMLMDLGHSVLEAPSAAHALRVLEGDAQFDVMITDYAMPGMTGLDLAKEVKNKKPKIPIILATGYAELPAQTSLQFPRLNKPYTQEELSMALEKVLRVDA